MEGVLRKVCIESSTFWPIEEGSCDCGALVLDCGNKLLLLKHGKPDPDQAEGCILIEEIAAYDPCKFSVCVDQEGDVFRFDKCERTGTGEISGLRFCADGMFLFIFGNTFDLVVTKSKFDLFFECDMDYPDEEAEMHYYRHEACKQ